MDRIVDENGQRRMAWLVQANRKAMVAQLLFTPVLSRKASRKAHQILRQRASTVDLIQSRRKTTLSFMGGKLYCNPTPLPLGNSRVE